MFNNTAYNLKTMTKLKGIIFDLDGTLLDSIDLILKAFDYTTEKHLHRKIDKDTLISWIGTPLIPRLIELAPDKAQAMHDDYRAFQKEHHNSLVTLFNGVPEMLLSLQDSGFLLSIATSKSKIGVDLCKPLFDPRIKFNSWIAVEDVVNAKPHPEPLRLAASRLELELNECIYVGDSVHDLDAARDAPMRSVGVSWGCVDIRQFKADYYVDSVDELTKLLLSL